MTPGKFFPFAIGGMDLKKAHRMVVLILLNEREGLIPEDSDYWMDGLRTGAL